MPRLHDQRNMSHKDVFPRGTIRLGYSYGYRTTCRKSKRNSIAYRRQCGLQRLALFRGMSCEFFMHAFAKHVFQQVVVFQSTRVASHDNARIFVVAHSSFFSDLGDQQSRILGLGFIGTQPLCQFDLDVHVKSHGVRHVAQTGFVGKHCVRGVTFTVGHAHRFQVDLLTVFASKKDVTLRHWISTRIQSRRHEHGIVFLNNGG